MELLAVTLVHTLPGRNADVLARVRLISDTVRNTPGLITSRFYRNRGNAPYYFMLTTWHDEESWLKARQRYDPKHLLLTTALEVLTSSPQQWLMHYLWGYSRPAVTPVVAASHLANIRSDQAGYAQKRYIEGLRRHCAQSTLAFAFLARGTHEESVANQHDIILLSLFSWGSEDEREQFYADAHYQAVHKFISKLGTVQIFPLEPM